MYTSLIHILSLIFDKFRGRPVQDFRTILERTQWMQKTGLQKLQTRKLKALLSNAYENVPYYHESFKNAGFHPSDFTHIENLHKIPVLRRSDLQSNKNSLVTKNVRKSEVVHCKTSGTTAAPVEFVRSKTDIDWDMAAQFRGYGWAGYETGSKLVYIRLFEPNDVLSNAMHTLKRFMTRSRLLGGYELSERSMAAFCRQNRRFNPDYIHGGPGPTNILATYLLNHPQYRMRPKAVFTYAETLLPHYRKTIEEAFHCKIHDWYGSTELAYMAGQCGHHQGHHVTDENVFLEVEKDGEPAAADEEGTVLLTNLNNHAMPFIRYEIGDTGKILDDECSCGRNLTLFTPTGRSYQYFVHSDGSFTFLRDLQTIFQDLPIEDFQVTQPTSDEIIIRIAKKTGYTEAHTAFIIKHVGMIISPTVKLKVEPVRIISPIGFGKIPHLISKIQTRYT